MSNPATPAVRAESAVLPRRHLAGLVQALRQHGYTLIGPVLREGAIAYDEIESADDLPVGWTDQQGGGMYRLMRRADPAVFGYAVGPHSWKQLLHPSGLRLWRSRRTANGFETIPEPNEPPKYAFLGVRSCDLHAIAVQDRVFLAGPFVDPIYQSRRRDVFIVAVNCAHPAGTCFCVSMNTGPRASFGYDLALTEVIREGEHYFLVEAGSERGRGVLSEIPHEPATPRAIAAADAVVAETARHMGRQMNTAGIKELLYRNYEHPRWDEVARRCLTCANCTNVCPTCFCTTIEDVTDLAGEQAHRWRRWDSCFTMDFSYIVGGSVRATSRSRYRQWMTHKLATWIDQFGTSGCIGCGRCITWCPVGIDITEEVAAIRGSEAAAGEIPPQGSSTHGQHQDA